MPGRQTGRGYGVAKGCARLGQHTTGWFGWHGAMKLAGEASATNMPRPYALEVRLEPESTGSD